MSKEEILQVLQTELPKLIQDDPLFRAQIVGLLTESLASRSEFNRLLEEIQVSRTEANARFEAQREEMNRRFEEQREETNQRFQDMQQQMDRRFEAMQEELWRQRKENSACFEAQDRRFEQLIAEMGEMRRTLDRLGARWGIQTEESVRKFAQEFIAAEFGLGAKKWQKGDAGIDVVIRDGEHFAIEIKSTVNDKEVERFAEIIRAYQTETGIEPKRKLIITAHGTSDAYKKATVLGVEIISG